MVIEKTNFDLRSIITLPSDDTHAQSNTALEDVPGMSFPVVNGATYNWLLFLLHNSGTTPDLDIAYSVPAGAGRHGEASGANGTGSALATEVRITGSGGDRTVLMFAQYRPTADGTIQLRYAQGVSDASDTKILAGTTLIILQSP